MREACLSNNWSFVPMFLNIYRALIRWTPWSFFWEVAVMSPHNGGTHREWGVEDRGMRALSQILSDECLSYPLNAFLRGNTHFTFHGGARNTHLLHLHFLFSTTINQPISIFDCSGSAVCVKNYPPEIMQPSSSTRATIVSAENQNGATIVKTTFFFCHYYIVWESNNAGEARGQSWNESLKSRWIPGGSCGYTSGTKRQHFAALSSPRPCWQWLQLQPSCGSPQCRWRLRKGINLTCG